MAQQSISKIKLAIIENNLIVGGIQRLVLDQLKTLDRERFEVRLITLTQPQRENFYDQIPVGTEVTQLHFRSLIDLKGWYSLYVVLRDFRPDVVKSSTYFSNTICRLSALWFRFSVITAEHNTKDGKSYLQRTINRWLSKIASTMVVDSEMVAEALVKNESFARERITVIPNGVDIAAIDAAQVALSPSRHDIRAQYGVADHEVLFLNIGRFVRVKNHARMIAALAAVVPQRPQVKLMIIGGGALEAEIKLQVQDSDLASQVILLEPRTDLHQFYVASDFTILSSDHEGFSIAAMEGLAFGKPLVSTRVAGVSEYLEDGQNGFFADSTPEDLAQQMIKCIDLSPEERAIFQSVARATALSYSVEAYGKKFQAVIIAAAQKNL